MSQSSKQIRRGGGVAFASLAFGSAVLLSPIGSTALAQSQRADVASSDAPTITEQIAQLRASVARLEAQVERERRAIGGGKDGMGGKGMGAGGQQASPMGGGKGNKGGMGSGGKGGGMGSGGMNGMRGQGGQESKGGMGGGQKGGGKMMGDATGTSAMGTMTGSASLQASLPGFPGASHLYHIGAGSFFLDHDEHIMLSIEQRADLGQIREQSQLQSATFDRQIAELEQELWVLTASDTPDIVQIEEKIRQIAKSGGDQRIAFIRSVGIAAQVLSEDQRGILVGDQQIEVDDPAEPSL